MEKSTQKPQRTFPCARCLLLRRPPLPFQPTPRAIPVFQQLPRSLNDSDSWSDNAISEEGSQGSCVY
eukprot:NODE_4822_length_762_cov_6.314165_g4025_i0.p5 GENE.NODE_4822_length_762_cov_6.314165_g4025_i0~~NODE_4822_length_762_cov_6.314165_g4025_i0.p5  ORF type:complete len:67 (-),score=7.20 NODE_4822_length_762_cov_6.314165_g4025_i0:19-219(-)